MVLISSTALGANIEEYEPGEVYTLNNVVPLDTCVCVPDEYNGEPSPSSCWPYDGCIGTGSGPCDDGIDNDCDCKTDCYDPQCGLNCAACSGNCDDPNCAGLPLGPSGQICSPGGEPVEFCFDDFDNDNDGYVDECDANCNGNSNIQSSSSAPYEPSTEVCDGYDNDCDGSVDEGVCGPIACYQSSDCGSPTWEDTPFCLNGNVTDYVANPYCVLPGTTSSYCSATYRIATKEECGSTSCEEWDTNYCENGDVYHSRACIDRGCISSSVECYADSYTDNQLLEDCPYGCSDGECLSHCVDGVKDDDETGVDCGGSCAQDCCNNNYYDENLGEEGVDCGGSCFYSCIIPVMLVHGYYSNPEAWITMESWLDDDGYNYSAVDLRRGYFGASILIANGDIKQNAEKLRHYIYLLRKRYNAKKVDIIAHSMGGLVSRWYVNKIDKRDVRNVIMLGTPNHGSELFYSRYLIKLIAHLRSESLIVYTVEKVSDFLLGKAGEQMTPFSGFLNELNNGNPINFWDRTDITSLYVDHYTYSGKKDNALTTLILFGDDDGLVRRQSVLLKGAADMTYEVKHSQLRYWYPLYTHLRDNIISYGHTMADDMDEILTLGIIPETTNLRRV